MTARSISRSVAIPFSRSIVGRIIGDIWTPAALFAQGQQGVWYEPKPQYLYQDAAGTVPVTADGDPVGLMLDRSRGLVLGPELVTNGAFDSDVSGWAAQNCTIASVDGKLVASVTGDDPAVYQGITTEPGKSYVVEFNATLFDWTGASLSYTARAVNTAPYSSELARVTIDKSALGSYRFQFVATNTTTYISFVVAAASDGVDDFFGFDNVSVREIPGNHATQSVSAARPVNSDTPPLQVYDNVDDSMNVTLPAIAAATVAIATPTGADIQYPVDLSSGSYTITGSHSGIIIREGELTAAEQQQVTDYLNAQAGV